LDLSAEYIARASDRYGARAEFRVGDATALDPDLTGFEVVLAFGVLHHLDDAGVLALVSGARDALVPSGRMVTVDPTHVAGQGRAARFIIDRDRGRHVREPARYAALAAHAFDEVTPIIRHDLLRIPYTHCILECSGTT
jgi:SAM-dependent methyltransferase